MQSSQSAYKICLISSSSRPTPILLLAVFSTQQTRCALLRFSRALSSWSSSKVRMACQMKGEINMGYGGQEACILAKSFLSAVSLEEINTPQYFMQETHNKKKRKKKTLLSLTIKSTMPDPALIRGLPSLCKTEK